MCNKTFSRFINNEELKEQFSQYVDASDESGGAIVGSILTSVFSLNKQFNIDPVDNLNEVKDFLNRLDWVRVKQIQSALEADHLTRRATTADILLGAINRGLVQLEKNKMQSEKNNFLITNNEVRCSQLRR